MASQQTTLFKFFTRTPKADSPNGGSAQKNGDTPTFSKSKQANGSTPKDSTPNRNKTGSPVRTVKPASSSPSTPCSRNSNGDTGKKRRRTEGEGNGTGSASTTPASEQATSRKKIRNGGDTLESPPKDFTSGSLVWALLEGYPWWPSMVRGETRGGPYYNAETMEYHVQFFDKPPTRAWIRKGCIKPYSDTNIPPAKAARGWPEACKSADNALSLTNQKRLDKYWHEFDLNGNEEVEKGEESCDDESITEMEVEPDVESEIAEKSKRTGREASRKRIRTISSSSEEENNAGGRKRGGKVKTEDDEYRPTNNESIEEVESSEGEDEVSDDASEDPSEDDQSEDEGKTKKRKSKKIASMSHSKSGNSAPATPRSGPISREEIRSKLQNASSGKAPAESTVAEKEQTVWTHMTFTWAKDGNRRDARKRPQSDPLYDPTTLFVPLDFLKTVTPGHRQWWDIKAKNFDTVIFFKVGKFYEFYHWDACIANKELGIIFMKGDYAHSGFPEISFSRFANTLIEKGYKIARVEQTETPEANNERVKKSKGLEKHDKCIRREVCQIATKGVRYASFQDDSSGSPFSPESAYLYAVVEKVASNPNDVTVFGVCFIDTTIGTFHIGQFQDDRHASRLRTLFSHYVPAQILYERNAISPNLLQLFNNMTAVRKDALISDSQFWDAKKVLKYLAEKDFFHQSDSPSPSWPAALQTLLSDSDGLGLTPDEKWELGVKSLGGVVGYLNYCLLDHDMISQKRFEIYKTVDVSNASQGIPQRCLSQKYMVLDGISIRNLDIVDGPLSLLSNLDKCGTNFGKRLLRHSVCLPLALPEDINERQDAVENLMNLSECRKNVVPLLKTLPDLERLLSKIHYLGSSHRSKQHPDGRANFFEEIKYSKNKIADLLSALKGFKTCVKIINQFKSYEGEIKSELLNRLVNSFPQLDELLIAFDNAFDHELASKEGKIKPQKGAIEDYDNAVQAVENIEDEANQYLRKVARELGTNKIAYFGSDKKRFQIEVPETVKVPKRFEFSSKRKGFMRYYCNETREFLSSIMRAELEREEILRDIARKIFEKFDKSRETWVKAVDVIANIDVLISLSIFSESQEVMCRPTVKIADTPFIDIVEGRHPCIPSDNYISNDTKLSVEKSSGNFVILTGPNMGGKSTLMRQVGLLGILSHLGCYVPAEKCEMSVIDRIFTRLGANDNIGEGESTFFVEMSETSAILKHATPDSLLLIDELGRGTATYDGTAIAYAVAEDLSKRQCRSLFSTHYHTLVEALQNNPMIQMSHMACMIENENEQDPTQESLTFLYKMASGPCPKSYGFNAARLAGISDEVIRVAHKKAKELETSVTGIRSFTDMCSKIRQKTFSLSDFEALSI